MNKNIAKRYATVLFWFIVQSAILFISAGTIKWLWAWVLIAAYICLLIVNSIIMPREVIEERGSKKENVKTWDRILTSLAAVPISDCMLSPAWITGFTGARNWMRAFIHKPFPTFSDQCSSPGRWYRTDFSQPW